MIIPVGLLPICGSSIFIAQLVEHCRANVEPIGPNLLEVPAKIIFGLNFAIAEIAITTVALLG